MSFRSLVLLAALAACLAGQAWGQGPCANGRCNASIDWLDAADVAPAAPQPKQAAAPPAAAYAPPAARPTVAPAPVVASPYVQAPVCVRDAQGRCVGGQCERPAGVEHSVLVPSPATSPAGYAESRQPRARRGFLSRLFGR